MEPSLKERRSEHEARYADHWITLYDPPGDAPAADRR